MKPARPYTPSRPSLFLRGFGLFLVIAITLLIALNRDRVADFATFGYAGAFLAMLVSNATLVLPAPGLIIVFTLGSSLNPVLVGICGAIGAALGELTGYITGVSGLVIMKNTRAAHRINIWMKRNGSLTIFALSIVPNPFFDLAGLMAGAGKMSVWKFLLTAFLGKSIQSTTIAFAGALSLTWVEQWLSH